MCLHLSMKLLASTNRYISMCLKSLYCCVCSEICFIHSSMFLYQGKHEFIPSKTIESIKNSVYTFQEKDSKMFLQQMMLPSMERPGGSWVSQKTLCPRALREETENARTAISVAQATHAAIKCLLSNVWKLMATILACNCGGPK